MSFNVCKVYFFPFLKQCVYSNFIFKDVQLAAIYMCTIMLKLNL